MMTSDGSMTKGIYDVFISYNRADKSFADFLVKCLEKAGLKCFQDVTGLKIFDKLDTSLKEAIANSRWLMAIISPNYLRSYWCLFEALEAIQGQDVEQRFFPLVLRYTPGDQSLDESFVLKALADLDEQTRDFERQMVELKAYDLSQKLDKLNFVRANLPKIFRMVHERIFPELVTWDDDLLRRTLSQIVSRLKPGTDIDFESVSLLFDRLDAAPVIIPRLKELPSILWQTYVGCQAWKNSPLVVGNHVLVGSAGSKWNEPDQVDGVYSLDAQDGTIDWFVPTPADANGLLFSKGVVSTGCDDGSIVAITARNGQRLWQIQLDSGIVGGPIKLSVNIANSKTWGPPHPNEHVDPILVVTFSGKVYVLDLWTGRSLQEVEIGHHVIGEPLLYKTGYTETIAIPTISGTLVFFDYSNTSVFLRKTHEVELRYPNQFVQAGYERPWLASRPVWTNGLILQGIVRETSFSEAPIIAIDAATKQARWIGSDPDQHARDFGNLRSAPLIIGEEVIFMPAYSDALYALSAIDGRLRWMVGLGQGMFQQWSGPIVGKDSIYLGRHDGYLHKVNIRDHLREWSIFLGSSKQAGAAISGKQTVPEFQAGYTWAAGASHPILATPVFDRDRLYVGTEEGYIYCVGNLGET